MANIVELKPDPIPNFKNYTWKERQSVRKCWLRKQPHEKQLELLAKSQRQVQKKRRDPGIDTAEDFAEQVKWVYSNLWRPDLCPADMPQPSWWTLAKVAKQDEAAFVEKYLKPLMTSAPAQKVVREQSEKKVKEVKGKEKEGDSQLSKLLDGGEVSMKSG